MSAEILGTLIRIGLGVLALCLACGYVGFLRGRSWSWIPEAPARSERFSPTRELRHAGRGIVEGLTDPVTARRVAAAIAKMEGRDYRTMESAPVRLQQRRTIGWRKPPGAVSVARPTRWGNPFRVGAMTRIQGRRVVIDQALAVALYERDVRDRGMEPEIRVQLRGKDLMCFCPIGSPCHGDVLLAIAND